MTPEEFRDNLDALHRQADQRRARQRRHYELAGGECHCPACQADGVVSIGEVIDEMLGTQQEGHQ
jgi:hypothetical protein